MKLQSLKINRMLQVVIAELLCLSLQSIRIHLKILDFMEKFYLKVLRIYVVQPLLKVKYHFRQPN